MNSYKRLLSNTALFAISTFASKLLTFLLMPFYTRVLSQVDYGVTDIIIQTGNLLIPLFSVGVINAVIRFGLDKREDKRCVFTVGLVTTLGGFALMLLTTPIFGKIDFLSNYTLIVFTYVLSANLHSLCAQAARSLGYVRLFALDGVARTVLTIAFNILLLAVFDCGVVGYVMANVIADLVTSVLLFLIADLWKYFKLSSLRWDTAKSMLRYCVPLIPTLVCTWIINISDRYLVSGMIGSAANGIYAVANKIPTVLLIVASIFSDAWQISAVKEKTRGNQERFFSNVFGVYQSIAFLTGSGLILTAKLSTKLLASPAFYEAWQYIPALVIATTLACFSSFLSSVYMVEKRSVATMVTTLAGAVLNIVGNVLLIPIWGVMGAAISTLASYFFMFAVRAVHTRGMLRIQWSVPMFCLNLGILSLQCVVMNLETPGWILIEAACFVLLLAANFKNLIRALGKVL